MNAEIVTCENIYILAEKEIKKVMSYVDKEAISFYSKSRSYWLLQTLFI